MERPAPPEVRRREIAALLNEHDVLTVKELAERFRVSYMTAHRDLDVLQARGIARKVRGGATAQPSSFYESSLAFRSSALPEVKASIARKAVTLVRPGTTLILDDSTTTLAMVGLLERVPQLTLVTNFLPVVDHVRQDGAADAQVILIGGSYNRRFDSTFDALAERLLGEVSVDQVFVSSPAVDLDRGAFHQDQGSARLKRAMLAAGRECVLLVDHTKFAARAVHRIAGLDAFDVVVVDAEVGTETVEAMRRTGRRVEIAT